MWAKNLMYLNLVISRMIKTSVGLPRPRKEDLVSDEGKDKHYKKGGQNNDNQEEEGNLQTCRYVPSWQLCNLCIVDRTDARQYTL